MDSIHCFPCGCTGLFCNNHPTTLLCPNPPARQCVYCGIGVCGDCSCFTSVDILDETVACYSCLGLRCI